MVVGKGMLDAVCPGDVFSAPPMDYVLETSKLLASPKGVLHIVNNYTGDRMAFEMGQEMAEADGITVSTLIVDDDVAVKDSTYTIGRRGVAGNFFVIKAVGAAAERGADLGELVRGRVPHAEPPRRRDHRPARRSRRDSHPNVLTDPCRASEGMPGTVGALRRAR
jgi:dihydroxyacetone kinase